MERVCIYIISIIYQSFISSYTIEKCLGKNNKLNAVKFILTFLIYLLINIILFFKVCEFSVIIIILHIIGISILGYIHIDKMREFMVEYSLLYYFHILYITPVAVVFSMNLELSYEIRVWILIAIILTMYFGVLRNVDAIFGKILIEKQNTRVVIFGSFLIDFIFMFNMILDNKNQDLLEKITYILFDVFLVVVFIYLFNIYKKSKIIFDLNEELEKRNIELRSIKNDHANIINYLFTLYKKDEKEDICKVLKKIINNEMDDLEEVKIQSYSNKKSLLDTALSDAVKLGIDIEIEEKCNIDLADIDGMELYRIILNIINNAIKAMNGKGKIRVITYIENKNIIIKIGNNGPKIKDDCIGKIFEMGFTTKINSDKCHGYGLSIVKELIENNKGNIQVTSSEEFTEFAITLPIKEGKY